MKDANNPSIRFEKGQKIIAWIPVDDEEFMNQEQDGLIPGLGAIRHFISLFDPNSSRIIGINNYVGDRLKSYLKTFWSASMSLVDATDRNESQLCHGLIKRFQPATIAQAILLLPISVFQNQSQPWIGTITSEMLSFESYTLSTMDISDANHPRLMTLNEKPTLRQAKNWDDTDESDSPQKDRDEHPWHLVLVQRALETMKDEMQSWEPEVIRSCLSYANDLPSEELKQQVHVLSETFLNEPILTGPEVVSISDLPTYDKPTIQLILANVDTQILGGLYPMLSSPIQQTIQGNLSRKRREELDQEMKRYEQSVIGPPEIQQMRNRVLEAMKTQRNKANRS